MVELDHLRSVSARIGADPLLVQAAGGNTSLKDDGVMWVKASGTWLQDAQAKDIFVPVDFQALRKALAVDDTACETSVEFVRTDLNDGGLRPSIETTVHALIPQRVVLHVHCVNTIAWAIRADAEQRLAELLRDWNWVFIPYVRPGLPLARSISARLKPGVDVLVLGNHGLVVAAETVEEAAAKLEAVSKVLQRPARTTAAADADALSKLAAGSEYRPALMPETHALAMDAHALVWGGDAVLYPDHAVFLGVGVAIRLASAAPLVAVRGKGVLVRRDAKPAVEPMGRCLADVLRRVTPGETLKQLNHTEIGELINWDAEKYRQNLGKAGS
jgi:rhamnose utilization protein RhaD (predicted bifunctional aldolase and dehydrogenase)